MFPPTGPNRAETDTAAGPSQQLMQNGHSNTAVQVSGVGHTVNVGIAATPQPVLRAALLPSDAPLHRFVFRARRAALRGRTAEVAALQAFVDAPARFAWWALTGPGGLGKSRLAFELCLSASAVARAGWWDSAEVFDWDRWEPDRPTIIVADYADAGSNADGVFRLLRRLASRDDLLLPVRVLLLARAEARPEDPSNWYARLTIGGSDASLVEAAQHAPPQVLGGLDDDALWSVVEAFLPGGATMPDRTEALADLRAIDPVRRPLFAAMAGDALGAGRSIRGWDQGQLLRHVLGRERRQFWYRDEEPSAHELRHERLLAVATLAGGVAVTELDAIAEHAPALLPNAAAFDPAQYARMVVAPATDRLAPLEPDVVGEFLVLDVLRPRHAADDRGSRLLAAAVGAGPRGTWDTMVRTGQDFPAHETIERLTQGPHGTDAQAIVEYAGTCRALANGMREGGHQSALAALYARIDRVSDAPHPDGRPHDPILVHAFWDVTFHYAWALGAAGNLQQALQLLARLVRDLNLNSDNKHLARSVSSLAGDLTVDWAHAITAFPTSGAGSAVGPHAAQQLIEAARFALDRQPDDAGIREMFARAARQVASAAGNRGWFGVARASYALLREVAAVHLTDIQVQRRVAIAAHDLLVDIHKSEWGGAMPTQDMVARAAQLLRDCETAHARFPADPEIAKQLGKAAGLIAPYFRAVGQPALARHAAALAKRHAGRGTATTPDS